MGFTLFSRKVKDLTGIDLSRYKSNQMERRLGTMMRRIGVDGYVGYARLIERDAAALKELKDFITINVSEFFRNPEKFDDLRDKIFPALLKQSPRLSIWSAGCSNGGEPYSMAMILEEMTPGVAHRILATDLDEEILKAAKAGRYPERDIKNVDEVRRHRHFSPSGEAWQVKPALQNRVEFKQHNLLKDPFGVGFDLIVCRNVVIYFTEETKDELYRRFHAALRPGGVLFVGGTESILRARELGFVPMAPFFYQKA
ncbi:MAG: CheR family methyltransferase [Symbiobacteriia bacterium]